MPTTTRPRMAAVRQELLALMKANRGTLTPEAVVERARPESSPLHDCFEWDDDAAAEQYRLDQARRLIRMQVEVIKSPTGGAPVNVRTFISLPSKRDRADDADDSPGYIHVTEAIRKVEYRTEMLAMMKADAAAFAAKYQHMAEAAGIIGEIRKVCKSA